MLTRQLKAAATLCLWAWLMNTTTGQAQAAVEYQETVAVETSSS